MNLKYLLTSLVFVTAFTPNIYAEEASTSDSIEATQEVDHQPMEWGFLPFRKEGFKFKPRLALKWAQLTPSVSTRQKVNLFGVELNINCPLLSSPVSVRQQVSYVTGSIKNTDEKFHLVEFNPHFVVPFKKYFYAGAGPGFGYMQYRAGNSYGLLTLQAGASAGVVYEKLYAALEYRYQYTEQTNIYDDAGFNNTLGALKIGYVF